MNDKTPPGIDTSGTIIAALSGHGTPASRVCCPKMRQTAKVTHNLVSHGTTTITLLHSFTIGCHPATEMNICVRNTVEGHILDIYLMEAETRVALALANFFCPCTSAIYAPPARRPAAVDSPHISNWLTDDATYQFTSSHNKVFFEINRTL